MGDLRCRRATWLSFTGLATSLLVMVTVGGIVVGGRFR